MRSKGGDPRSPRATIHALKEGYPRAPREAIHTVLHALQGRRSTPAPPCPELFCELRGLRRHFGTLVLVLRNEYFGFGSCVTAVTGSLSGPLRGRSPQAPRELITALKDGRSPRASGEVIHALQGRPSTRSREAIHALEGGSRTRWDEPGPLGPTQVEVTCV